MNCKHCNAELEEGVKLCPACGMAQEEPETAVEEAPVLEETTEAPVVEEYQTSRFMYTKSFLCHSHIPLH